MNKETLIQYCDLKQEIKKLENRIDKIQKQSDMVADVVQNGYKGHAVVCGYDCDYIQSKQGIASGDSVTIRADRSGFGGNPDISCSFANTSTGSAVTINYTKSCSRTSSPGGFEVSCDIGFTMPAYNVTMTCDFVD